MCRHCAGVGAVPASHEPREPGVSEPLVHSRACMCACGVIVWCVCAWACVHACVRVRVRVRLRLRVCERACADVCRRVWSCVTRMRACACATRVRRVCDAYACVCVRVRASKVYQRVRV